MLYHKWKVNNISPQQVTRLAGELGVQSLLSKVLVARNVTCAREVKRRYLEDAPLSDPYLMKDMDKAVERIWRAVQNEEKIVVYGDYDVDGVCATATLFTYLESIGANVFYKLPNRENEGYGLNSGVLKKLHDRGVSLVITVDNGIAAIDEVEYANSIGLDVVITDHHLPKEELPRALAIVDPLRKDDESPCKTLAGVGVAFKLVCAMENAAPEEMLDYYADFVAVGTVADLMLLEGENRTIVKFGLEMLNSRPRCGFEALLRVSGALGKPITSDNISYTIAPRINAAGRMSDATSSLELLLSENEAEAEQLAEFLESENRKRQETQNKIAEDITAEIRQNQELIKDRVIVVWGEEYHPGVVGIVSSKLMETYGKPAIVFTKDGDSYKGSGRSVSGFSLYNRLTHCSQHLIRYGGHELAAGLTIEKENLEIFRREINNFALQDENMSKIAPLEADCEVNLNELTVQSVSQVDYLAPFGNGNPAPSFMVKNVQITAIFPVSEGKHLRIKMRQGNVELAGMLFSTTPQEFAFKPGDYIDACISVSIYEARNGPMVSIRIKEVRPARMTDRMIDEYEVYSLFVNSFALSESKKRLLRPDRNDVALVYRKIMAEKVNCDDLRPLFCQFPQLGAGKVRVIIDLLLDLGLIEMTRTATANCFTPVSVTEKKDLMSSRILLSLQ